MVNGPRGGAVHIAAARGYPDLPRLVQQFGMDPNATDRIGMTPLFWVLASVGPIQQTVTQLVELGADIDYVCHSGPFRGYSVFGAACQAERWDVALQLLDLGATAEVNRDHDLDQPLYRICESNLFHQRPYVVDGEGFDITGARCAFLTKVLEKGTNPNAMIVTRIQGGELDSWIRKHVPDGNYDYYPAFTFLLRRGFPNEAKCLLQCPRLDIEQPDSAGRTAIAYALTTTSGCSEIAELLLEKGVCLPNDLVHDFVAVARRIYKAARSRRKKLLKKHRGFQKACGLLCKYSKSFPDRIHIAAVEVLRKGAGGRQI